MDKTNETFSSYFSGFFADNTNTKCLSFIYKIMNSVSECYVRTKYFLKDVYSYILMIFGNGYEKLNGEYNGIPRSTNYFIENVTFYYKDSDLENIIPIMKDIDNIDNDVIEYKKINNIMVYELQLNLLLERYSCCVFGVNFDGVTSIVIDYSIGNEKYSINLGPVSNIFRPASEAAHTT